MKLKALLLGSAAAMIAITGARAADAVIAEPEPVEYVRVCDMYGAGFFYIPGTETCLRISGYVDSQYEYTSVDGANNNSTGESVFLARVNFDAREETDYGLLRSYIRIEGGNDNSTQAAMTIRQATIQLGGFETGYNTEKYGSDFGHKGLMLDGLYSAGTRVGFADYTFAANGFSATAGFQLDPRGNGVATGTTLINGTTVVTPAGAPNLGPEKSFDPYLNASYSGSIFYVAGALAYDTSDESLAYRARLDVKPLDGFEVGVWYYGSENAGNTFTTNEHEIGVYATYAINEAISVAAAYDHAETHAGVETEAVTVGLDWKPVNNLIVRMNYRHTDNPTGTADTDEFRVRIRRSF
ncbi:MAG: porin [Pseudomonadota bacterium]